MINKILIHKIFQRQCHLPLWIPVSNVAFLTTDDWFYTDMYINDDGGTYAYKSVW